MSNSTQTGSTVPLSGSGTEARKARLSVLAKARAAELTRLWAGWLAGRPVPEHEVLRPPEIGAVMVRGRAGATGAPFNLGEMTVTRAVVRLTDGAVGHGHVQGRSKDAALIVALIDALYEAGQSDGLEDAVIAPLRDAAAHHRRDRAAKAAATKVEFFTMVRGENG